MSSTLETERLILRPWRDDDLAPLLAINTDPRVLEHLPAPWSEAQAVEFMGAANALLAAGDHAFRAVEAKEGGALVGMVGLKRATFEAAITPCVEVAWRLAPDAWGRGYATEAAVAVMADGFARGLDEIVSFTVTQNARSARVMERIGMARDEAADFDHPFFEPTHRLSRHIVYRARRSDWSPPASR